MINAKTYKEIEKTFRPRQIIANCLSISRVPIGVFIFLGMTSSQNSNGLIILSSYHPSPRNVNTKRINLNKMVRLFKNAKKIIS